ncbi:cell division protein [Syntrophotalea acetylenivorans]|uniref:Cell division protein FtsX n=1 Tax=Syntrophotalea acetylenivorans TaxID=1842532 RepID=A0A1L3GLM2_9BACT|nr:permease-like cell division protein FtsX [Syntrophotalea acetylenivorans]APG26846.1 cell division protein [Syntrophotalea acetylenivorans]
MLDRTIYLIRRVFRNIKQSPILCTAAIGTVAVALTVLAFFALIVINVQSVASHWSEEIHVVAYLDNEPQPTRLADWRKLLLSMPEVAKVTYVDRDEAFRRFSSRLGPDSDLLEGFDSEILPASLEISLKVDHRNRQAAEAVVSRLKQNPDFSDFSYGQDWLDRFEAFLDTLRFGGYVLGAFLLFAALFIVSNTIKLTLYARRDELEIMSLVGATSLFIKTPFLLEGAFHGTIGSLIALGGSFALFQMFLQRGLTSLLLGAGGGQVVFLSWQQQLLLVATGTTLGVIGSVLSLRKFVRI